MSLFKEFNQKIEEKMIEKFGRVYKIQRTFENHNERTNTTSDIVKVYCSKGFIEYDRKEITDRREKIEYREERLNKLLSK